MTSKTPNNPVDPEIEELIVQMGLPVQVKQTINSVYLPIAHWIARKYRDAKKPLFIGVNGAQGSGKTTFCALLAPILRNQCRLRAAYLSIDDIYHTRATRQRLAHDVHPLCEIRGVPGTHDIELAHRLFEHVLNRSEGEQVLIPRFDKARDDRKPEEDWDSTTEAIDVIFLEGWCVGCPPLPPWDGPYNERERREDPDGTWMKWSIQCLESEHRSLFQRLDGQIFIAVPSMETVRKSRWLQEQKLRKQIETQGIPDGELPGLMTQEQVTDYVALFERYTEHMLERMPGVSDVVITRDDALSYALEQLPVIGKPRESQTTPSRIPNTPKRTPTR